jgi:hypothetical protein
MKNASFLRFLTVILFIGAVIRVISSGSALSQTPNEKLLASIPPSNSYTDAYSFKYNPVTGAWVYSSYDTTSRMYTLVTSKGTSKPYNFAMQYNALFDYDGNVYTIASETVNDTLYNYYIIKNTEAVTPAYTFISEGWAEKNGVIYFSAQEGGKYYFVSYDMKSGTLTKSRPYDEVRLVYVPVMYSEGEPMGYVGFTKDNKPYYVAVADNEAFLVIGGVEQKHYSDISYYEVKMDANDVPVYIAKDNGKLYETRGNTFVVHGSNEYKKFDWVYGPIIFDKSNNPVYVGQDSTGEYLYRSTIMSGPNALKTYDGSIYTYSIMPNGKLAYVASLNATDPKDLNSGFSMVVVDGKEGKKYNSVGTLKFSPSSEPIYTATDKKGKTTLIVGTETVSEKYDYIPDFGYLADGTLYYIGTNYGNYEKKQSDKNYVMVHDEISGPYDFTYTSDWATNTIVLSDKKGNYAYVAGKNIDYTNYIYKYNVITNNWTSDDFDIINDARIINGKVTFFSGTQKNKGEYIYTYRLHVNNKPVGNTYNSITEVKTDGSGKLSFIASRDNNMYLVEVNP